MLFYFMLRNMNLILATLGILNFSAAMHHIPVGKAVDKATRTAFGRISPQVINPNGTRGMHGPALQAAAATAEEVIKEAAKRAAKAGAAAAAGYYGTKAMQSNDDGRSDKEKEEEARENALKLAELEEAASRRERETKEKNNSDE